MSRVIRRIPAVFTIFTLFIFPFLTGCGAASKGHLNTFNRYLGQSDYENSALFAQQKIAERKDPKGPDLLWTLQLATVERIRKDYQKSTNCFDKAEDMLKFFDEQAKIGSAVASTIASDNIVAYKGEEYDGVMINVYKALNFMAEGKRDLARVEFNRALDRQRRAKEKFIKEINKLKTELEQNQQKDKFSKTNVENPKTQELLTEKYPNLYNFEAYPDFVNPFATYLAGVFFNLVGDHSKAVDLLKESYGMVKDNSYIAEDFNITDRILDGKGKLEDTVWLVFENGLGPVKEEFRLDIPLFVATNKVKYVGIALPKLAFRNKAYPYLATNVDGKEYKTCLVADMDRVIQTEFSKDFKSILTRAIISATAKAVAQYALEDQDSYRYSIASTLMAVYSFATTSADIRIWTSLPKEFQIARFEKPKNGRLIITPPGSNPLDIQIPDCNNALVYVRIITRHAAPVYEVITF